MTLNTSLTDGINMQIRENTETAEIIMVYTVTVTVCFGLLLEILCFILFFYHFIKATIGFQSKYFYTLGIGYFIAIISFSLALLEYFVPHFWVIDVLAAITRWYMNFFLGPWNSLLALNRCTALLFWRQHSLIWSKGRFAYCIAAVLIYPIITVSILYFQDPTCFITMDNQECEKTMDRFDKAQIISNGINISSSSILGITVVLLLRFKIIQISRNTKSMELHLLLQSIISLSFYIIYCIFHTFYGFLKDKTDAESVDAIYIFQLIFCVFSNCYCLYYHLSSTFLLFCLSDTVRKRFIDFYFCCISKRRGQCSINPNPTNILSSQTKQMLDF